MVVKDPMDDTNPSAAASTDTPGARAQGLRDKVRQMKVLINEDRHFMNELAQDHNLFKQQLRTPRQCEMLPKLLLTNRPSDGKS